MNRSVLSLLQEWYTAQCDGDWEHQFGIRIETLDNPGWAVKIDLQETKLEDVTFNPIKIERNESDWVNCYIENGKYFGYGGPQNLEELLLNFMEYVKYEK